MQALVLLFLNVKFCLFNRGHTCRGVSGGGVGGALGPNDLGLLFKIKTHRNSV